MSRWGMAIDLAACTGCGACVVACRQENNLPDPSPQQHALGRDQDWIRILTTLKGQYPETRAEQFPMMCQQCDEPPCTKVCPVGATYPDEDGIVAQIYSRCIGCRYCTNACPYSVKTFNWTDPVWGEGTERRHNPDVSLRPRGVVEKCTFCYHRRQVAEERAREQCRELGPHDYVPACVETCPAKAMTFGDLDDPTSKVAELARDPRAERKLEELGTQPKVFYLHHKGDEI